MENLIINKVYLNIFLKKYSWNLNPMRRDFCISFRTQENHTYLSFCSIGILQNIYLLTAYL